jgi:L-aspartate oxidase
MAYHTASETLNADILVVGSGIAGLTLCHALADTSLKVVLCCKGKLIDSNTSKAQGGLAAVTGCNPLDSPQAHLSDTLSAGAGLSDPAVAAAIVENGKRLVDKLVELGVRFDGGPGAFDTALEGGHSQARVLHSKDASGRAIATALIARLHSVTNINIIEDAFATDLIVSNNRCIGAEFLKGDSVFTIFAQHTVLATGGIGQVFARTTNPKVATGDGIAMAYRAGATLADMEFVQFHPTALAVAGAPAALVSEAVRGAGAVLLDDTSDRFAFRYHASGELATRDVVARAIYTTMIERDLPNVWLDMRPIGSSTQLEARFPNIISACRAYGIDPVSQPIPIAPAAHYFMGGVLADIYGQTTVAGLYALGETACTGLHGANRLASNSLLEGGVMALMLAELLTGNDQPRAHLAPTAALGAHLAAPPNAVPANLGEFQQAMFKNVGLERCRQGLERIVNRVDDSALVAHIVDRTASEAANIALVGWLVARAALERRESRGAHWRSDYPAPDDVNFGRRLAINKKEISWLDVSSAASAIGRLQAAAPSS